MPEIDWGQISNDLIQVGIAYLLALPVAWDRAHEERSAGLRTFPLVSIAACGYMLVGIRVLDSADAEARIFYGIIAGMGFIGGGAILKSDRKVTGTATAASLWMTGAIGIAVAFHRYEIALVLAVLNFVTLRCVNQLK
ncbi:MAG: MgtC/SapB family protein [Lysobacterales bacterium]